MPRNLATKRIVNSTNRPLASLVSNHLFYYPTPSHLNYNWSFGSLVGLFFALQIVSGIFLAMHYTPHIDYAFASVEHIMTDVNGGYLFRYFHANGASAVFILMYLHISRNLYYQSYLTRRVLWHTGLVIFLLMMATAFIGYVLPWGQMSFWGATVITSLVTAVPFVGEDIAYWVWGGFSINNATLTRFFSLHYLLPFLITGLIGVHLVLLHTDGSSDPLTLPLTPDKISFHPYFSYKDSFIFLVVFAIFGGLATFFPNLLGHSDNFLPANPLVTPAHIVPEWYFTPFYAILRACPNKLGGAIGMFAAILLLFFVPFYVDSRSSAKMVYAPYSVPHRVAFWLFVGVFLTLMFLGSRAAAAPYVGASKLFTALYFSYFLIALPALAWLNESLLTEKKAQVSIYSNLYRDLTILAFSLNFSFSTIFAMDKNNTEPVTSTAPNPQTPILPTHSVAPATSNTAFTVIRGLDPQVTRPSSSGPRVHFGPQPPAAAVPNNGARASYCGRCYDDWYTRYRFRRSRQIETKTTNFNVPFAHQKPKNNVRFLCAQPETTSVEPRPSEAVTIMNFMQTPIPKSKPKPEVLPVYESPAYKARPLTSISWTQRSPNSST